MTLASVSVVDVLQKGTSAITGQADANGLTIGGLQRHRASASLIAGSGRSNKTNLRKTGVQFLRWSVRELCTVTTDMTTGRADGWMTSMGSDGRPPALATCSPAGAFAVPAIPKTTSAPSISIRASDERPR
jgi:hypothetical protein